MFPYLWRWLAAEVASGRAVLAEVVVEELRANSQGCHAWLGEELAGLPKARKVQFPKVSDAARARARQLAAILEQGKRRGRRLGQKGVNWNDLYIIALAEAQMTPLVTNEADQTDPKTLKINYKIPAVCRNFAAGVRCQTLIEYLLEEEAAIVRHLPS